VLILKSEYNTLSSTVNEVEKKKKRLHYQEQQRQLQESYFEILIGMKLMVRRAPLFPLI